MARNSEKAQSMLNRFLKMKQDERKQPEERRPFIASECTDLTEAERWRIQVIRETSRKVTEIQNGALGEHRIRDLNDEINKLVRERGYWEKQILTLGGPDYARTSAKQKDSDGRTVVGEDGYMYFGAARNLPGVRDLLERRHAVQAKRRTRGEMFKLVDADYYGFRDDDDGLLVKLEKAAEQKAIAELISKWRQDQEERQKTRVMNGLPAETFQARPCRPVGKGLGSLSKAHVPLPSQKEIERQLLQKRKQALLEKYKNL